MMFKVGEVVGAGGGSDGTSQNSGKKIFEGKVCVSILISSPIVLYL